MRCQCAASIGDLLDVPAFRNCAWVLRASASAYDTAQYEAYGKRDADIQADDGANPALMQDPARWGGQWGYYTDQNTGLVFLTHRYYNFHTGQFMSRDPIGYNGGVNLYAFGDNPVNSADPLGLRYRDWVDYSSDFFGGMGGTLSAGATDWIDQKLGTSNYVGRSSAFYVSGEITGVGVSVVDAGAGIVGGVRALRAVGGIKGALSAGAVSFRSAGTVLGTLRESKAMFRFAGTAEQQVKAEERLQQLRDAFAANKGGFNRQLNIEGPDGATGEYNPRTNIISLYKNANEATELHELLHFKQAKDEGFLYQESRSWVLIRDRLEAGIIKEMARYGFALNE